MLAPIVVFVYNRPEHARKILRRLMENDEARESELFIFSDGPKSEKAREGVKEVREIIHSDEVEGGFKTVRITESDKNKGLAQSIISGVTEIIDAYGKVIVVEDDSYCSCDFLHFMNDCLDYYQNNPKIWSIGGFSQIALNDIPSDYQHDVYIMGRTCSCAWATWKNRWDKVDWEVKDYNRFKLDFGRRRQFNKYGRDRAFMLDEQMLGKIDSWAIRFCYSMFNQGMYTLLPVQTKIKTIGRDGSGTHTTNEDHKFDVELPTHSVPYVLEDVDEDMRLVKTFRKKFDYGLMTNARKYVKNVILKL
jgi:hypothetical protein